MAISSPPCYKCEHILHLFSSNDSKFDAVNFLAFKLHDKLTIVVFCGIIMVNLCVRCEMYFRLPWKLIYNSCSGCMYIATFHLWWYCVGSRAAGKQELP